MRKILTIAQREYTSRVFTKIFWVSVLLVPVGMLALILIPVLASNTVEREQATIQVIDDSGSVLPWLGNKQDTLIRYEKSVLTLADFNQKIKTNSLVMPKGTVLLAFDPTRLDSNLQAPQIAYQGKISLQLTEIIERDVRRAINAYRLKKLGFDGNPLEFRVMMTSLSFDETGKVTTDETGIAALVGYVMAFLNYMMVFIYGMMVMRGVVEEKSNRIVEVILSSVKPFQMMAGKLLGICAVGLTQFALWVGLSMIGTTLASGLLSPAEAATMQGGMNFSGMLTAVINVLSPSLLICFIFYFLGGFFLFGSLFGAIGSAVDQEQDTQQLMWPVTIPLIIPMLLIGNVLQNPNGSLAVILSIIPFSSPTIMMIRLAATDVPFWQIFLSMSLLLLGIVFCIWVAARIYRTGLLMYGKKPTLREMARWIVRS